MFPIVGFHARQILRIVGSQIGIFTSLRRFPLLLKYLDKLVIVNNKWPNGPKIGCKSLSSLVDFIEINVNLEKVFERALEG
jgi:hypothetical protein